MHTNDTGEFCATVKLRYYVNISQTNAKILDMQVLNFSRLNQEEKYLDLDSKVDFQVFTYRIFIQLLLLCSRAYKLRNPSES
jgi:hypothetical protein